MELSADQIKNQIAGTIGKEIVIYDVIDSTNNAAKLLAKNGSPHGAVVFARMQTAGKGRKGKHFFSPAGSGIYMTMILRPKMELEQSMLITSAAAVAVAQAIEEVTRIHVKIKWVNDLYHHGKKLCGILTEAAFNVHGQIDYVVVGVGINILPSSFPPELQEIVTCLEDAGAYEVDGNKLAAEILNRMDVVYNEMETRSFIEEYKARSCVLGKRVQLLNGDESTEALALDIDRDAHLIVETEPGVIAAVSSGEISLKGDWS